MAERDRQRTHEILFVTWVGFWINLILSVVKIAAGILGNSRAVVADGVHSLSDLVTDIVLLVGVRFWMAPPDATHPYGHKRLESLVSFSIGILLGLVGIGIAWEAISRIGQQEGERVGSLLALSAVLATVIIKEILYRWTAKKGRELKSEALGANAWHHRSDALSSIPISVAVAVAMWFPAWAVVDLIGAIVVAGFILYAAWKICLSAARVLIDGGTDDKVQARIAEYAVRTPGVMSVHDLRTRFIGQGLQVDLHACVDANLTVGQGNAISHALEDALCSAEAAAYIEIEIFDVLVHIDPWRPPDTKPDTPDTRDEPDIR
jgi:cation diffusion facilitator family transporter